ncbi:response regulator [Candidatus Giovannonibacteria bacterium]|nr:response regulator [Candidatus Giovannonibacteria bacterium]
MKILIIEDDKFLRDLMTQKLANDGFTVEAAVDGEEGLKAAMEGAPDLIVLDLILPRVDGFGVLEKIKGVEKLSHVPVFVLSNLGQKEDVTRALSLGAEDFLIKSNFTLGEIVEKIKAILNKKYL